MSDEANAQDYLPSTLFGTTYPSNRVVGMLPTEAAAQAAAAELRQDEAADGRVNFAPGEELLRNETMIQAQRSLSQRLLSHFPSEEARMVKEYTELAAAGYAVVSVLVDEHDHAHRERIAATLRRHGAVNVHYFGQRTTEDL